MLAIVGLEQAAGKRAGKFSLGMAQRLGIATALLGDPEVLMLDEPVNGLDPEGIRWLRTLLRSLAAEGRTVFVVSHLISEMALTADDLIVVGQGRLLAQTTVAELSARAASLEEAFLAMTSGASEYQGQSVPGHPTEEARMTAVPATSVTRPWSAGALRAGRRGADGVGQAPLVRSTGWMLGIRPPG